MQVITWWLWLKQNGCTSNLPIIDPYLVMSSSDVEKINIHPSVRSTQQCISIYWTKPLFKQNAVTLHYTYVNMSDSYGTWIILSNLFINVFIHTIDFNFIVLHYQKLPINASISVSGQGNHILISFIHTPMIANEK